MGGLVQWSESLGESVFRETSLTFDSERLGGRDRETGSDLERARVVVTVRIKSSLGKLRENHAELADHLAGAIRTGRYCAYEPSADQRIDWEF